MAVEPHPPSPTDSVVEDSVQLEFPVNPNEAFQGTWRTRADLVVAVKGNQLSWGYAATFPDESCIEVIIGDTTHKGDLKEGKVYWDDGGVWQRHDALAVAL